MNIVNRAIAFASAAHNGQTDLAEHPYILHPLRVMTAYHRKYPYAAPGYLAAAVLHDVVEDCEDVTLEDIGDLFSSPHDVWIPSYVDALTQREGETHREYLQRLVKVGDFNIIQIKICDTEDNASLWRTLDIPEKNVGLIKRNTLQYRYLKDAEASWLAKHG